MALTLNITQEVNCEQVPEGSFPPLVSGVHQMDTLDAPDSISELDTSANILPEDERNTYELPPSVNISDDGVVDINSLYDTVTIDNEVEISEETVEEYNGLISTEAEDLKRILFKGGASTLLAFDQAAGYTEAILRDTFGAEAEIEQSVLEASGVLMSLDLVCYFANKAENMPESVKNAFLTKYAEESAITASEAVSKKQKNTRYNSMLSTLNARVRSKQAEGGDPMVESPMGGDERNTLGTVRTRK